MKKIGLITLLSGLALTLLFVLVRGTAWFAAESARGMSDFAELVDFTKWARFERMGAFAYSAEDGTWSGDHYDDDVPEEVKQQRLDRLMRVQQHISAEIEAAKIGQTLKTIIDRREGDYYVGRTEFCSPEVDPEVLIAAKDGELTIGEFYDVKITDAEDFDLYGTALRQ